ncbi:MAG: flagellin [Nitrospinaceae bacterium]
MALQIFTNVSTINSQRSLETNRAKLGTSISRIASGVRITKSADDVAGLAVSQGLYSDVRALKQGARNLSDGLSLINAADGALNEQAGILIRLRELASQAATGTIGQTERETIQLEFDALRKEVDRIGNTSEFNGQKLIDGSLAAGSGQSVVLQIGLNSSQNSRIDLNQEVNITAATSQALGFADSSILTQEDAQKALESLTQAISQLSGIRSRVGANQNQLIRALNTQNTTIESLTGAVSTIKDADLAEEFAQLTKNQILVQAGAAMVGQSNLIPQSVLTLLQ